MTVVNRHAPGTFCWPELGTCDVKQALEFYAALFGWTKQDIPMDGGTYGVLCAAGAPVGGLHELAAPAREQGAVPQWTPYVAVEDAEAAVKSARAAGGTVLAGPFDVGEAGRMAVIVDPQGATLCVWEGHERAGATALGTRGALGWSQLEARDGAAAKAFYTALFGWTHEEVPAANAAAYTVWHRADGPAGGMLALPPGAPPGARSHWLSYFVVADVGATHATALALGARSCVAPRDVSGGGCIAVLCDPQGAAFGIMSEVAAGD